MIVTNAQSAMDIRIKEKTREHRERVDPNTARFENINKAFRLDDYHLDILRQAAKSQADNRQAKSDASRTQLREKLIENTHVLEQSYYALSRSAVDGSKVCEADKWLLDNYYLIKKHIEIASSSLPRMRFWRSGKSINDLTDSSMPLFDLVNEYVICMKGQVNLRDFRKYLDSYQAIRTLKYNELWAIPNMMRLALIQYLSHAVLGDTEAWSSSIQHRTRRIGIRNCIASLLSLDSLDWKKFIEHECAIERILRQDPANIYMQMEYSSRDHYRHHIENIAYRCKMPEEVVAGQAIELARQSQKRMHESVRSLVNREDHVQSHVGFYLVGQGRQTLEKLAGYKPKGIERLAKIAARNPFAYYLGAIIFIWLLILAGMVFAAFAMGISQAGSRFTIAALVFLSSGIAAQFAVNLISWLCSMIVPPRFIMSLDFSKGIPDLHRAIVVVPAMMADRPTLDRLVRQLEVRYAANRDNNLLFALLTDFRDANRESLPEDEPLLSFAQAEIQRLNDKYCSNRMTHFYLLHRPRKWNPREGKWMGEERKRGKLADLNQLLRSGDSNAFSVTMGDLGQLARVRYVITLDTDTQLPRDAGRKLVGRMAHPLNWPRFDDRTNCVVEGYAIMQPRVGVSFPEANRSIYSRLLAGDPGIDPYTGRTSNMYFDVFARGSYIGKGIYDVDAFEKATNGRFPDNRILSHDLIESCYASCGFINDVDLFEGVPSRFLSDMNRRHRWIRGDWQIAAWLMRFAPSKEGKFSNPLSWLSKWKIFDNLRRSITPAFLLCFLLLGWGIVMERTLFWTLLAIAAISGLPCIISLLGIFRKPAEKPWIMHLKNHGNIWLRSISAEMLSWSILPYAAYCNLDAILRVFYRLIISKKKNLEWTTSSDAEAYCNYNLWHHYRIMWPCLMVGLAVFVWLCAIHPFALSGTLPLLAAWLAGPWIAWLISRPHSPVNGRLESHQIRQLRRWARRSWHYYEIHSNRRNHGLPPDNMQEAPGESIVCNTSPTNIGLGLLSALAAYDFGYLSASSLLMRTSKTLKTMQRLERYRGHFFNWYNIRTLQPIEPRFISSIDSGNLWSSLIVLHVGLEELPDRPIVSSRLSEGLQDTLDAIEALSRSEPPEAINERFETILMQLHDACKKLSPTETLQSLKAFESIHSLAKDLNELVIYPNKRVRALSRETLKSSAAIAVAQAFRSEDGIYASTVKIPDASRNLKRWTLALLKQITEAKKELSQLAFWSKFLSLPHPQFTLTGLSDKYQELYERLRELNSHCTVRQLPEAAKQIVGQIEDLLNSITLTGSVNSQERNNVISLLESLRLAAINAASIAVSEIEQISLISEHCRQFCQMDFRFLYNPRRQLLSVGFNASKRQLEGSCYDLMASESRLTSFLAVSHGQLPVDHWFALGRMVNLSSGKPVLLSWSGSMFEYLMPSLFMPSHSGSIAETSCRIALQHQIQFARHHGVPWGISESCYHETDLNQLYQYRAFGVPELSLRQKPDDRLVITPYASALAIRVAPHEACSNLMRLEKLGCLGPMGFYDALDYTKNKSYPNKESPSLCRIVMAHHNGMILLAFANELLGDVMIRRFLCNPFCEAHDLLLQERIPQNIKPHRMNA